MAERTIELRPTIDREWLEHEAERDPLTHAYALWDLSRTPDRIRFVSCVEAERTLGYLLVWLGHPSVTVVHWVGTDPRLDRLADSLPGRPLVAVVPEEMRSRVEAVRGPARAYPLLGLVRDPLVPPPASTRGRAVRPLVRADWPRLVAWARRQADPVVVEYPALDLEAEVVWGAFDRGKLVGAVHATVRLPQLWVLGGVYVNPSARGQGWGRDLVGAAVRAAERTGARVALFVREDRREARRLYKSLGFRDHGRRVWLDLGAALTP